MPDRDAEETTKAIFETHLTPGVPQWLVNNPDELFKAIVQAIREGGK